jgi:outer membrane lipoprotein-sorting protein
MKKIISFLCLVLLTGTMSIYSQSLKDVLDKYYDAVGMDALTKTNSLIMKGKVIQSTMELPMELSLKRPNKVRMEADIQGTKFIQVYNGKEGWAVMPWTGSTEPQALDDEQVKSLKQMSDIEGELYNWKEKGYDVTLEGSDDVEGTPVYKVKVVKPGNDEFIFYLDKDNYIILKSDAKITVQGSPVESSNYYSNFKMVDGMAMPYSIETRMNGQVVSQIEIDTIALNKVLPDSLFEKPVVAQ